MIYDRIVILRTALFGIATIATIASGCFRSSDASTAPITIIAPCGRFANIETAAAAEDSVDWWDAATSDDDACTESFAATELRQFLATALRIDARDIRLESRPSLSAAGDVLVLGNPVSNPLVAGLLGSHRAAGPGSTPESFRIRAIVRGHRRVIVIAGHDRVGTLYGVYEFLHRLGVRFDGLGETGITYPTHVATLPREMSVEQAPAFRTRGFWAWEPRGNRDFFLWMARNRMNLWTAAEEHSALLEKLGIRLTAGGHAIQKECLDPAVYFEKHPDWFGLHGGQRSPNLNAENGDNYCTSNPDATRELCRNLVRSLSTGRMRHADVVELWMLDEGRWCECDRCKAIGSPTDRMLQVLAAAGEAIAEARRSGVLRRPIEITAGAYRETSAAPSHVPPRLPAKGSITFFPYLRCYAHALADPLCHEINRRASENLAGWTAQPMKAAVGRFGIGEYYNVSYFASLPLVFPHVMSRDIEWYWRNGARDFQYMHAPTRAWGTWSLDHAVLAASLWHPGVDVDSVIAEFCHARYPSTAMRMRDFYRELEVASANILAVEHCIGAFGGGSPSGRLSVRAFPVFPLQHLQYDRRQQDWNGAPAWTEIMDAMHHARSTIDAAQRSCSDSIEGVRLREDQRRFAYGEAIFAFYDCLIRTAVADHSSDQAAAHQAFAPADSLATLLRNIVDLVQVAASHANARDGLAASHVEKTYEYYRERLGAGSR